jgi:outer membrane lipoprotein SlyB
MQTTPSGQPGQSSSSYDIQQNAPNVNPLLLIGIRVLLGAMLGGIGGAIVGTIAGSAAGPIGAVSGSIMGAVMGFIGAGIAVALIAMLRQQTSKRTPIPR